MRINVGYFQRKFMADKFKGSCSEKMSNRKIRNLLGSQPRSQALPSCFVLGSQRHVMQILWKLFAVSYNLKNFPQISIIARTVSAGN